MGHSKDLSCPLTGFSIVTHGVQVDMIPFPRRNEEETGGLEDYWTI